MRFTRRKLYQKLIEDGVHRKDLSLATVKEQDILIYRNNEIETLFLFGNDSTTIITMSKKTSCTDNKIVDDINKSNANMKAYYKDDEIVLTMVTVCDNDAILNQYKVGLAILVKF